MQHVTPEWIKRHLPPRRGAKAELARAVGIDTDKLSKILSGIRGISAGEAVLIAEWMSQQGTATPGFAETSAAAWSPNDESDDRRDLARVAVAYLGHAARSPACYALRADAPGFALLRGDVVIADLGSTAKDGDVVVAQEVDPDTATASTLICRLAGRFLLDGHVSGGGRLREMDRNTMSVVGPIVASFRAAP